MNASLDTVTRASGSVHIAVSAYQKRPTKRFPFLKYVLKDFFCNKILIHPIKSLRMRPEQRNAPSRLIIRFTRKNWIIFTRQLFEGTLRREPATTLFD